MWKYGNMIKTQNIQFYKPKVKNLEGIITTEDCKNSPKDTKFYIPAE